LIRARARRRPLAALTLVCLAAPWAARAQEPQAAPSDAAGTTQPRSGDANPGSTGSIDADKAGGGGADPWAALGLPPAGQSGAAGASAGGSAAAGAEASADPWGFDEAAHEETWADILRPQAADLAITTGFFAFALVSFFRRSVALKYTALAMSVLYLGVMKSTLISITDIFRFVHFDFPQFKYSLAWYLIAAFTVVTTVLWGRLYCGRICAFGAFTQLLDAVVPKRLRWEPSATVERYAGYVKYGLLVAVVAYYALTDHFTIYRYVEPFWMYTRQGTLVLWSMLAVLLLATLFVRNLYCRFLCPVGATLGLISQATTLFRIKRWAECKTCRICERTCEWGAIRGPQIIRSECVRCDDCERLYADQKKCVHWVVLYRRSKDLPVGARVGI
jgi:Pyruvate/2-oxoacid:ferredoxin oxidoreductase delta subunit